MAVQGQRQIQEHLRAVGTTPTTNAPPPEQFELPVSADGRCPQGTSSVGSAGSAGQPGTGSIHCLAQKTPEGSFILPTILQIKALTVTKNMFQLVVIHGSQI